MGQAGGWGGHGRRGQFALGGGEGGEAGKDDQKGKGEGDRMEDA
jgi:hypothetical protein